MGWLGLVSLLAVLFAVPAQAGAQPRQDGSGPSYATFEGRSIDLSREWGAATACLIWRQGGVAECFRTSQALDAREAQLSRTRTATTAGPAAAASVSCSSSLRLYESNWYGGRRLSFWDRGYWQNLANYGFEDQMSSYIVGGCSVYLAEHADGGGWWYPGPTYPYAGEPVMSWDWQDTISSIYIG